MNPVLARHSKRLGRRGQSDDPKTAIIPPEPTPNSTRTSTRASTRTPSPRTRNRSTQQEQDQEQDNCPTIRGRKVATQIRKTLDRSGRHSHTEEQHGRDDDHGDDDACLEDEEEEEEKIPRLDNLSSTSSSFRKALFTHPNPSGYSLPFRLPASLSSLSMASSGRSPRSKSPVKSVQDLQALERPVYWSISASYKASRRTIKETNADFLTTFDQVHRIISGEAPFLPLQLRDELEQDDDFEDQPDSAYTTYDEHNGNNKTGLRHLQYALHEIRDIVSSTNQCQMLGRAEPAWNELVHGRVLRLATRHSDSVQAENVTRATIVRPFIPNGASSDAVVSGKIVDYALALQLPPKDLSADKSPSSYNTHPPTPP
ncbi:hypothetical protein HD806DRAFT_544941 [Xylariaceae sp. AK1471]|nr:hypothetical protein HD806DRAFT_544941 [Xylariaceae sp. AK1471]